MPFHACGSVVLPVARSREGRLASVGRSVGQVAVRAESNYPKLNKELLRRDDPRRCLLADETRARARARARASCETGCNGVQRAAVSPAFPSHWPFGSCSETASPLFSALGLNYSDHPAALRDFHEQSPRTLMPEFLRISHSISDFICGWIFVVVWNSWIGTLNITST
jgi:hypothetical protein